jgi:phosphatidylglycerol:prolipoprotein diacylglycerol transferase
MPAAALLASIGWEVIDRFHFGSRFALSPHGLGIAAGFLAGSYVFTYEARKRRYPEERYNSIILWALIGTIIGARLGYVFTHLSEYHNPANILKIYQGGLSQLGGVAGAILVCYFVIRRYRLPFLPGLDAAAIPIPLGVVIGRIGDLIIGDHLGKPTSWLLAFKYHGGNLSGYDCSGVVLSLGPHVGPTNLCTTTLSGGRVQTISSAGAKLVSSTGQTLGQGVGVHQTALYDLLLTMGLVLLLVFLNRKVRRTGVLFWTYAVWYGTGRIITDFLRVENRFLGLTGSQWTSTIVVAFGVFTLIRFALRPARTDVTQPVDPGPPVAAA